jgi:hypothetical protein
MVPQGSQIQDRKSFERRSLNNMKDGTTTKAALARELGAARSRLTQMVRRGMPVRSDGLLDRRIALEWVAHSTSGAGGGWCGDRRERDGIQVRAQSLLDAAALELPLLPSLELVRTRVEIYEDLRSRIPGVVALIAAKDKAIPAWLLKALLETIDTFLGQLALALDPDLVDDEQSPLPELEKPAGISEKDWGLAADRSAEFLEALDVLLGISPPRPTTNKTKRKKEKR